jgi:tetratricopeptide (TPR) repeat protein
MKLKLLMAVMLIATLSGCAGSKKPTQKEVAIKQWNHARAEVLGSLAKNQLQAGNLDQSRQTINQAVALDPENAALRVTSGKIFIEQGQLEVADQELSQARKLDPKNAEAEYLNGVVYQRWQKNDKAYECYLQACQKDPNELAYVLARAEMLVAMNQQQEALAVLQSKLNTFEHNPTLQHAIGQLLADQGKYTEAVAALRQASILAPDDLTIREHLAMALFEDHQYRDAADSYGRLIRDEANAKRCELWIALGECQMQIGRASDARNSFDTATQLNASSVPAWLSLAKATLELGDTRRAEIVLRRAISLDGASGEAHLMMGYVRLRQNKLPEAMTEFQKASALDRSDPVSLCMIGYVLEKSGKPEQAMKYYSQALKVKPNDELASKLMASVGD